MENVVTINRGFSLPPTLAPAAHIPVSQDMASPPDSSSGGAAVLRILSPPGDFVLGQMLLPQGESSPCTGTLAPGYFLRWSACPRMFPPVELLS